LFFDAIDDDSEALAIDAKSLAFSGKTSKEKHKLLLEFM